jgi:hypothetical protein
MLPASNNLSPAPAAQKSCKNNLMDATSVAYDDCARTLATVHEPNADTPLRFRIGTRTIPCPEYCAP